MAGSFSMRMAAALVAGAVLLSGYTCCNFHYNGDWINDRNYAQLPVIPAGAPITVKSDGRYMACVDIDGKSFRLGLNYGRTAETTEQWGAEQVAKDDPKAKLAGYTNRMRRARPFSRAAS